MIDYLCPFGGCHISAVFAVGQGCMSMAPMGCLLKEELYSCENRSCHSDIDCTAGIDVVFNVAFVADSFVAGDDLDNDTGDAGNM